MCSKDTRHIKSRQRYFDGFEFLEPEDVADAITYAVLAPPRVNIALLEILPTLQVAGGLQFSRRPIDT